MLIFVKNYKLRPKIYVYLGIEMEIIVR